MEQSKETIKKITLGELKNELPIHVKGKPDQSFSFIDWGMAQEEEIAKLKSTNVSLGKFVTSVLAIMVKNLNGEDFTDKDLKSKKLIINQQFSANILYMYLYLRYDQVDEDIRLSFTCPHCGSDIKDFIASLNDLDVDCKHGDYKDTVPYKLVKPITLEKGNQSVEVLKLGLSKWDLMERAENKGNTEYNGMVAAIKDGIKGVEGVEDAINLSEIVSKLKKRDMVAIHSKLSEVNAGPDLTAEIECTSCAKTGYQMIDWSYDGFFGVSSLPLR